MTYRIEILLQDLRKECISNMSKLYPNRRRTRQINRAIAIDGRNYLDKRIKAWESRSHNTIQSYLKNKHKSYI